MEKSDLPPTKRSENMAIPSSVQKYLESQNVSYGIENQIAIGPVTQINGAESQQPCVARLVLLEDKLGKVQVIIPNDCLLDLSVVAEQLGRDLKAVSNKDLSAFGSNNDLEQIPAIPLLNSFPLLADSRPAGSLV